MNNNLLEQYITEHLLPIQFEPPTHFALDLIAGARTKPQLFSTSCGKSPAFYNL